MPAQAWVAGLNYLMQLLDRPISTVSADVAVINAAAQPISGQNQKTFARLKTSLRLNLRRQIFLAVCDDLDLRNRLVNTLQTELAPRFINLNLNLADPNPIAQVSQWLTQRRTAVDLNACSWGFQILGIEHLTRQPAAVQKRFLTHLQAIEYYMPALECTMLLWLPRPWLRSVQQSAPTFWDWHTALFEFEGDPTPARIQPAYSAANQRVTRVQLAQIEPWIGTTQNHVCAQPVAQIRQPVVQPNSHVAPIAAMPPTPVEPTEFEETALLHSMDFLPDTIWDILTQDLAQLQGTGNPSDVVAVQPITQPGAVREADTAAIALPLDPSALISHPAAPAPASPYSSLLQTYHQLADQPPAPAASPLQTLIQAALAQHPDSEQHQFGWATLERIEQLQQQNVPQNALAAAYYALGRSYRECIEQGDQSEDLLAIAVAAHEQTIEVLESGSNLWADVANDLGNLYWMRSRNAAEADIQLASLEQAIQAYHLAFSHTNPAESAKTCAMIQNNLGSAYGDLAQYQQPAANLQKSVQAYETASQYRSLTDDPARYAATQNNLGTACWNLAQHQQPGLRLQQAIAAYQEALRYYTADNEPLSYAMIQNNLGTAYWNLAQHVQPLKQQVAPTNGKTAPASPEVLLQLAIAAYQNALVYRTLEAAPSAYAATQNNLGTAHWDLANLPSMAQAERRERLQAAITSYEAAIGAVEVLTAQMSQRPALTFDVFATHNNLGLAHYQLATAAQSELNASDRQKHLETALHNHLKALQGWENLSDFYQSTLDFVVQTVRALFNQFGIPGQNLALSQIPANLLPDIMTKL